MKQTTLTNDIAQAVYSAARKRYEKSTNSRLVLSERLNLHAMAKKLAAEFVELVKE